MDKLGIQQTQYFLSTVVKSSIPCKYRDKNCKELQNINMSIQQLTTHYVPIRPRQYIMCGELLYGHIYVL
jgi:hypothetical protein